jgi:hypothetical protein
MRNLAGHLLQEKKKRNSTKTRKTKNGAQWATTSWGMQHISAKRPSETRIPTSSLHLTAADAATTTTDAVKHSIQLSR